MANHRTSSGEITFPDGIDFRRLASTLDGHPLARDLLAAGFTCNDAFRLELEHGGAPIVVDLVKLTVPALDGHVVVLVEREGAFTWRYPKGQETANGSDAGTLEFELLPIRRPGADDAGTLRIAQEVIAEWLGKPVCVYVLRFPDRASRMHGALAFEGDRHEGLVPLTALEPAEWGPGDLPARARPPGKILLLVHDLFSSTKDSFGGLASTEGGRGLLAAARARYDLVLGFDHHTLTQNPLQNAERLVRELAALGCAPGAVFDAIVLGRGGLVARSLIERVLPLKLPGLRAGKIVFVGCANGGTELARPENRKRMLNLYTNLTLAGARLVAPVDASTSGATLGAETFDGIFALVQQIAVTGIDESRVPGLAAMSTQGDFVRALNEAKISDSNAEAPRYLWTGATFDVAQGAAPGISPGFQDLLQYYAADPVFAQPNDLVVDCVSMGAFGLHDAWLGKPLLLSSMDRLYHTIYFTSANLHDRLGDWLLDMRGVFAQFQSTVRRIDGETPIADVPALIGDDPLAATVVVQRNKTRVYYHLLRADELRRAVGALGAETDPRLNVNAALRRDEAAKTKVASQSKSVTELDDVWEIGNPIVDGNGFRGQISGRTVVLENGEIIGFVPDAEWSKAFRRPMAEGAGSESAHEGQPMPQDDADQELDEQDESEASAAASAAQSADGTRPGENLASRQASAQAPGQGAESFPCHFESEMPSRPRIGELVTVSFRISREELHFETGATHAGGEAAVKDSVPIIVTASTSQNCRIEGDVRLSVPPPEPGVPRMVEFKVRGLSEGPAEVSIIASQEQRKLITIVLSPSFVAEMMQMSVQGTANLSDDEGGLIDLRIRDTSRNTDQTVRLEYDLSSDDLQVMLFGQSTDMNTQVRSAYIKSIYDDIEAFWAEANHASMQNPGAIGEFMETFQQNLCLRGAALCDQLVPIEVRRELWSAWSEKRIGAVRVYTREPSIPWEMLYLRDPSKGGNTEGGCFLAELGLLRWDSDYGYPPAVVTIDCEQTYYLIPDYPPPYTLSGTSEDRQLLKELFDARPLEATASSMHKLFGKGRFDLFHAGCHGEANQNQPWDGGLLLQPVGPGGKPEYLRDFFLQGHAGNRPLVFLNACQVGVPAAGMTGAAGLGITFLKSCNAAILVAPMWSVGDMTASLFARVFYQRLAEGAPLVTAVRQARNAAKEAGDPSWLAYSVWGHPYARLNVQRPARTRSPSAKEAVSMTG
ncbi:CHAT domain-containing protein [Caballeronia jiangsuensis]|uniref:CHAT domain-containing protein n=1 Tax=Caballeronia jiangsuensis TaxID=1458357 RepID=A0ABW9CUW3_9BURK